LGNSLYWSHARTREETECVAREGCIPECYPENAPVVKSKSD
jgi:hypothetical protein